MAMAGIEKGMFLSLFNRGGYVLDFTSDSFDIFTMGSVGVPVCGKYGLSKGKSLTKFVEEASPNDATKLLCDLLDYYEAHFFEEIEGTSTAYGAESYRRYYEKCKPIAERERAGTSVLAQRADLEAHFTSEYMHQQIDALFTSRETYPTEAIGKSKELIESCCKTILKENGEAYDKNWNLGQLIKATMKCLDIDANEINAGLPAGDTIKRILSSLGNIAGGG